MDNICTIIDDKYKNNVEIVYNGNNDNPDGVFNKYIPYIKSQNIDWLLHVDMDELLCLKENSIHKFINSICNKSNIIQFRWTMIERFDNDNMSFNDTLKNYNHFSNIHIKTMGKMSNIQEIGCHHMKADNPVVFPNCGNIYAYDNFILHIHTRSLNNAIMKSLITKFPDKKIKQIYNIDNCTNLNDFIKSIGLKLELPFMHAKNNIINVVHNHDIQYENDFCNKQIELQLFKKVCNDNNINYDKLMEYLELLQKKYQDIFKC